MESSLEKLDQQERKYTTELDVALEQYAELQQRSADMDTIELNTARHAIRPDKEYETLQRLQATYGKKFDSRTLAQSRMDVAKMLSETAEPVSIRQKLQQLQGQQNRQSHEKERSQERFPPNGCGKSFFCAQGCSPALSALSMSRRSQMSTSRSSQKSRNVLIWEDGITR